MIVTFVVLALAAPAAAGPADGWSGWSWSSVAARLGGWADGLWRALAGSETDGEEDGGGDDVVTASPDDTTLSKTQPDPPPKTDSAPEIDPNGTS